MPDTASRSTRLRGVSAKSFWRAAGSAIPELCTAAQADRRIDVSSERTPDSNTGWQLRITLANPFKKLVSASRGSLCCRCLAKAGEPERSDVHLMASAAAREGFAVCRWNWAVDSTRLLIPMRNSTHCPGNPLEISAPPDPGARQIRLGWQENTIRFNSSGPTRHGAAS